MTKLYIEQILKMRMAVYQAGIKVGIWKDINLLGASDMMNYIFTKSGQIAYYNLIVGKWKKDNILFINRIRLLRLYQRP